ncbi:MAG TPA: dethiobiotin synthase [Marmoricola sp.]|nr:dethiobiotin synthase [Marmoricola sp.]
MTGVLFVTGTDTGVGKTVVTAALAVARSTAGGSPYVIKPAQTGVGPDEPGDLDDVRRLAPGVPGHEGVRLREPLAPDTAARLEGADLPGLAAARDAVVAAAVEHDVLVEGAGGVLVNLGVHWNLLDLAQSVAHAGVPAGFVVVARSGLGTLNHTALTVQAIQQRDLRVRGIVIGSWPAEPDLASEQNLLDLPALTGVTVLGQIPEGAGTLAPDDFAAGVREWLPHLSDGLPPE